MQSASPPPATAPLAVVPTPPPPARLSDRTLLDEATRPQGPVPAARGYSAAQQASAQHLVDIHDHLRAELNEVRSLVERVLGHALSPAAARSHINVMTMRQHSWSLGAYCQSYCRLVTAHHSLEDVGMLPHLQAAQPELGPVVEQLQAEHRVIHHALEELDRALVRYVDDPGTEAGLQEVLDLLTDTLLSHLSYEEHQLVEPLARFGYGIG